MQAKKVILIIIVPAKKTKKIISIIGSKLMKLLVLETVLVDYLQKKRVKFHKIIKYNSHNLKIPNSVNNT